MNGDSDIEMPEWMPLEQAIDAPGVRLVLARLGVPSRWRDLFSWVPKTVPADGLSLLLTHRDRIYDDFLKLPVPTV
jgi:hypothetical protein